MLWLRHPVKFLPRLAQAASPPAGGSSMSTRLVVAGAALAVCCLTGQAFAAHGWGTGGDSSLAAITIYDLQHYGGTVGYPATGDTVKFTGKIVTALDTKPTTYGFWI